MFIYSCHFAYSHSRYVYVWSCLLVTPQNFNDGDGAKHCERARTHSHTHTHTHEQTVLHAGQHTLITYGKSFNDRISHFAFAKNF